ncbi:hypothetical protein [Endozoicomonas lisbonensis]|uniref:Uncharacterized protein n=1 Tax=Endozoicomonas lisbonensis TaxID=3120522 RepID=A0ABV2SPL2_9GAMM
MSGKIKIALMMCCVTFSHSLLAVDYVTGLLLREPLVMRIDDVPVEITHHDRVTTLVIPAADSGRAMSRSGSSTSQASIKGHCDSHPCPDVRQLHSIQQWLAENGIPELELRLNPFSRTSSAACYSDDAACEVRTSVSHFSSASFVLSLSFISNGRRILTDLPYAVRRSRPSMRWLWGESFFHAHYAGRSQQTLYFDPLQEGVLTDILNTLNELRVINFSQHLGVFSPGQTVSYGHTLFDRDEVREVGTEWLRPLGSIRTDQRDSDGQFRRVSTYTSGYLSYSVSLPSFDNLPSFSPSIGVTLLPTVSQQFVKYSRGIAVTVVTALVVIAGAVYQSSGHRFW